MIIKIKKIGENSINEEGKKYIAITVERHNQSVVGRPSERTIKVFNTREEMMSSFGIHFWIEVPESGCDQILILVRNRENYFKINAVGQPYFKEKKREAFSEALRAKGYSLQDSKVKDFSTPENISTPNATLPNAQTQVLKVDPNIAANEDVQTREDDAISIHSNISQNGMSENEFSDLEDEDSFVQEDGDDLPSFSLEYIPFVKKSEREDHKSISSCGYDGEVSEAEFSDSEDEDSCIQEDGDNLLSSFIVQYVRFKERSGSEDQRSFSPSSGIGSVLTLNEDEEEEQGSFYQYKSLADEDRCTAEAGKASPPAIIDFSSKASEVRALLYEAHNKREQLSQGITARFFRSSSNEKKRVFDELFSSESLTEQLSRLAPGNLQLNKVDDMKTRLNGIVKALNAENIATLNEYRGFKLLTLFGRRATSGDIASKLKMSVETLLNEVEKVGAPLSNTMGGQLTLTN